MGTQTWGRSRIWVAAIGVFLGSAGCARGVPGSGSAAGGGGSGAAITGGGGTGGTGGAVPACGEITQVFGDCRKRVCQGGAVVEAIDDTDAPTDGTECTVEDCIDGTPSMSPAAAGATCADSGGKVCDGEGHCVACVDAGDCAPSQGCSDEHTCVPATCVDGQKDGDESDVDCGGSCGPTCAVGETCLATEDCAQGTCLANECKVCSDDIDCPGGHCADGVCCDSACDGPCEACTKALRGAGTNGLCGPIMAGNDPEDECPGALVCSLGSCKLPVGAPCVSPITCAEGSCADGVCCDAPCTETCMTCVAAKKIAGPDGVCGDIAIGTDPDEECPGDVVCGGAGSCASLALGLPCTANVECESAHCVDGVCCEGACAGDCLSCSKAKKGSGTDGQCGFVAAGTDPDEDCPGSTTCDGDGSCTLLPLGAPCTTPLECASLECSDAVCCQSPCDGVCEACSAAKKGGGLDGACEPLPSGADPEGDCPGATQCNGSGACALLPLGTPCTLAVECQTGFCADGVCCNSACDDSQLCRACSKAKKGNGQYQGFQFEDGVCYFIPGLDPDDECPGAEVCNWNGECRLPIGHACSADSECVSGYCVDGFCCDGPCTAGCKACSAAKKGSGTDGVCGNIGLGLDPDDECLNSIACNGAGYCAFKANSSACAEDWECSSGHCVEGVCCENACNTACFSCLQANKQLGWSPDGDCGPIKSATDPYGDCPGAEVCDGSGGCKKSIGQACQVGPECASAYCVDGVCCNTSCNSGCLACSAAKKGAGADGTCAPVALGLDPDNDCFGVVSCNGFGGCNYLPNGAGCGSNWECQGGHCADGVCCNSDCLGLCLSCIGSKTGYGDGLCAGIIPGTDPDGECSGATPNCAGSYVCGP